MFLIFIIICILLVRTRTAKSRHHDRPWSRLMGSFLWRCLLGTSDGCGLAYLSSPPTTHSGVV